MSIRPLTPKLAEKARSELNEDPKRIEGDLQHLKDWVAKQPHLRVRTDDQWLIAFLRGCKFSLERTKEKLDLFYTCRTTAPDVFRIKPRHPLFSEILNLGTFAFIPPPKDSDEPMVVIIRPGSYNADKISILDAVSVTHVLYEIVMMEYDNAVVSGVRGIVDLEGVTMSHFLQMTPANMKKMVVTGQDASPFRQKGVHYLNTPTGFETVFNALKSLLNEKNRNRLFVHNKNYEEMYQYIPKHMLPNEYGGTAGTVKEITELWKNKVEEFGSWFEEGEKYGTDEAKRPGKPKTAEELYGVDGSFRQLDFD